MLGPDRPAWTTGYGRLPDWPDARITGLWEHHAVVACNGPGPDLGAVIAVIPNHVCTAVNLVPELPGGRHRTDRRPLAGGGAGAPTADRYSVAGRRPDTIGSAGEGGPGQVRQRHRGQATVL